MRPYFSLIIPYHNSSATIGRLLGSIKHSKDTPPLEVIVVDDGSEKKLTTDNLSREAGSGFARQLTTRKTPIPIRVIRLFRNRGPAAARNRGAKVARGKFLVFLDSDVELFPDALGNLAKLFQDDPDVVAATGVWVRQQRSRAFFPNFKALRDWSYWTNERDLGGYYFLFSTRIAAIKKTVFHHLGGFNESYLAALVEDIELTYRIARRYAIIFAPNVRVHHEFPGFWPIAQKYFWRSYHWVKLYRDRKKFDPVATTSKEAAATLSAAALVTLIPLRLMSFLVLPHAFLCYFLPVVYVYICFGSILQWLLVAAFFLHLFLVRKFIWFVYREKGIIFAVKSLFAGLALYCFIFAGALWGRIR